MQRKVLIIGGAAGSGDHVGEALARFGFGAPATVDRLADAPGLLRSEHYDLVIVPLEHATAVELATIEREIRRAAGSTAVLGTAPNADPQLILHAMRSGIQEFVVYPPEPKELNAALDRLLRRSRGEVKRGLTVAVYSAKGGLGTSTVALGLAHAFARNNPNARVALADFVAGGDVGVMLDLKPAYDVGDLVEKVDRIDEDLLYSLLTPASTGLWVLPASDRPEAADLLDGQAGGQIVSQLRAHFAFTVVDCEHHMSDRTLAALDAADRVLLVTHLNVAALRSTQRTITLCDRLGYAPDKVCVVVNRHATTHDVMSMADASKVLDREIFWMLPNDYRTATGALNKGVPIGEYDAASKLAASYVSLAAKLAGAGSESQNGKGRGGSSRLGRMMSFGRKG